MSEIERYQQAQQRAQRYKDDRYRQLERLEKFVEGTQYEGRPSFWAPDVPLWDCAPCVVYPIVQSAIRSNVDLVLGEGRFPNLSIREEEDAGDSVDKERAAIDALIEKIAHQARLKAASRDMLGSGQGAKTAVAICSVKEGRHVIDVVNAKWCTPEFDQLRHVTRLVIQYPYIENHRNPVSGETEYRAMIYRRELDSFADVVMAPVEARDDGRLPNFTVAESTIHAFGYCPVVWYPFMRGCRVQGNDDGHAVHENLTDEIEALDFALSQRHRAALYAGDPQWTEIGVQLGHNPAPGGKAPSIAGTVDGGAATSINPVHTTYRMGGSGENTRKKSPGIVWQYDNADTKVQLHTLPGDALQALDEHARDLRVKISDALAVVFIDPDSIKFAATLSGRALESLRSRQLDRCDQIRDDFADGFLVPIVDMLLRITLSVGSRGEGALRLPGLKEALPALSKFLSKTETVKLDGGVESKTEWVAPDILVKWGPYFKPEPAEESALVDLALKAKDGGLITIKEALEKLRGVFAIDNVDALIKTMEEEKAAEKKAEQEALHMLAAERTTMPAPPIGKTNGPPLNPKMAQNAMALKAKADG